ncbi:ABC transporter ATP-binding protein [Pollutimonas thiosulfatoxidans]|uniref:ABC transporter ATP-binding protein n=1 Tax=Pollutimonas thiosulfatoxidans TaxID=2028345 RepID=A0A410GG32_9BURK|nr:ABC transporter ATP-binding protein [Pollutimonas thiosulfatoxidans]QAA95238.1 ABC transporter ATP-binding protein [Pollutimonas thiosulfatoxidans]
MTTVLKTVDLRKSFGSLEIIRGLTLEVQQGERHAILGPNGAGKSTLFHLISGLLPSSSGSIWLKGQEITSLASHRISRLGLSRSFQITTIFPKMTVFENLRIGVMAKHHKRFSLKLASRQADIISDTDALIEQIRLESVRDNLAGDLTYSEQRALEIAMALASGGDVILLDEPTAGMSREESMYIVDLVRRVTEGKTLLLIEHDMDVVFSLADRISVQVYGEIIATGEPEAIRQNKRVQEAYLGEASS